MQIHGPGGITSAADIRAHFNPGGDFAVLSLGCGVVAYLYTEAEADAVIKAACAAKGMLHAAAQAALMAPLPDRGRYDAASAAEVACSAAPPAGTNGPPGWRCAKAPGHDGLHETSTGGTWGGNTFMVAEAAAAAEVAEGAEPGKDLRVTLCRCDRDPRSHVPWPGCPQWENTCDLAGAYVTTGLAEGAQAAEIKRIGQLHADGLITGAECAAWTDKVIGAAQAGGQP